MSLAIFLSNINFQYFIKNIKISKHYISVREDEVSLKKKKRNARIHPLKKYDHRDLVKSAPSPSGPRLKSSISGAKG